MSSTNKPEFCNNANWNEKLESLLRKLIKFPEEKTAGFYYDRFKQIYENDKSENEIIISNKISFDYLPAFSYVKSAGIENITNVGIDFPTYFNYKEKQPVIMVVGIDPLRSGDDLKDKISVGTPYALHSKSTQNESNLYWLLVGKLVKENYTVYLTDTFKLYFNYKGINSYKIPEFTNPEQHNYNDIHQEIFKKEIDIIEPAIIITLGAIPRVWFTNFKTPIGFGKLLEVFMNDIKKQLLYDGIPVLPLMHLSGNNRLQNFKNSYDITSRNDIIPFYVNLIKNKTGSNKLSK